MRVSIFEHKSIHVISSELQNLQYLIKTQSKWKILVNVIKPGLNDEVTKSKNEEQ